jgi:nucleoside-diphosphate-sugar epimerase
VPVGTAVTEAAQPRPTGAYGLTKLASTALVLAAARHGLAATVLRVFNLIGPGTPATLLPGRLVAELRTAGSTGAARVGCLAGHRDFVDVRDAAAAVAATASTLDSLPPLLNVGSGRATSLRELATEISIAAGGGSIVESAPGSPRSAELTWQCADIDAIHAALGWRPTIDLETSVRDMWRAAVSSSAVGGRR